VFENRVLRSVFGPKRDEVTGECRKLPVMFKLSPASLQTFIDTRLTLTPSVNPNSNYVTVVSD
jgi:hypothetical protein